MPVAEPLRRFRRLRSPDSRNRPRQLRSARRGGRARRGGSRAICRSSATAPPISCAVDNVVAVHANAHYTYLFDGTSKLFCPLPISDVEARLDTSRFVRVHRSHIVNIERVVRMKRAGDSGLVELAAADHYAVPVSRSRVGWLKSRIGVENRRDRAPVDLISVSSR